MQLVRRTTDLYGPPISTAAALVEGAVASSSEMVLDLAQGAPNYPPADSVVARIQKVAAEPDGAAYTEGGGLPDLRKALALELSGEYQAEVADDQVLITAGANQAFCLAISTIAENGDEIILPTPFYFNHDMWIRLDHLHPVYVGTADPADGLEIEAIAQSITTRTRALVVVSPGNPTGFTASPGQLEELADLAQERNIALILDETYRSFRGHSDPPHHLYERGDWPDFLVTLQSFSKDYALPGYRVGALVAASSFIAEAMKAMDCVAICAPRVGQEAALEALRSAHEWKADRAREVAQRHVRFRSVMASQPGGFRLQHSGGFYGWVDHYERLDSEDLVLRLAQLGVLAIPGNSFMPGRTGHLRFAFANLSQNELDHFALRLNAF